MTRMILAFILLINLVCASQRVPFHLTTSHNTVASCKKPFPEGQGSGITSNITISSSGVTRWYLITFPSNYTSASSVPVIFSFHGGVRNATNQLELSEMSDPEFNDFAIAVYPQGINDTWEGIPGSKANDIQLVSDIIDQLDDLYCIDKTRIWATGKSDGGGFCNTLACDPVLSMKIAAFSPVSAAVYVDTEPCFPSNISIPCNAGRIVPMMEFHGGNDTTISDFGGPRKSECLPTITHWIQDWALRDGLAETNVTVPLTNDTVIFDFGDGDNFGLVRHIMDESIGHDWPSTVPNADNQVAGHVLASFNATPIIIEWFKQHTLPGSSAD